MICCLVYHMNTRTLLHELENILIPFRLNSTDNPGPEILAAKLVDETDEIRAENFYFYKFFADILFLMNAEDSDRFGIGNALPGLEKFSSPRSKLLTVRLISRNNSWLCWKILRSR